MPEVVAQILIQAPVEKVYALAKDIEGLAAYIQDVEEVKVVERQGNRTVTEWVGILREFGRRIRWREVDEWDDKGFQCRFEQQEGEFQEYRGLWTFRAEEGSTRSEIRLTYRLEIPLIGPLIQRLIHAKVQQSCQHILQGLKQRAEESP